MLTIQTPVLIAAVSLKRIAKTSTMRTANSSPSTSVSLGVNRAGMKARRFPTLPWWFPRIAMTVDIKPFFFLGTTLMYERIETFSFDMVRFRLEVWKWYVEFNLYYHNRI